MQSSYFPPKRLKKMLKILLVDFFVFCPMDFIYRVMKNQQKTQFLKAQDRSVGQQVSTRTRAFKKNKIKLSEKFVVLYFQALRLHVPLLLGFPIRNNLYSFPNTLPESTICVGPISWQSFTTKQYFLNTSYITMQLKLNCTITCLYITEKRSKPFLKC